jgi:hypothetical protein
MLVEDVVRDLNLVADRAARDAQRPLPRRRPPRPARRRDPLRPADLPAVAQPAHVAEVPRFRSGWESPLRHCHGRHVDRSVPVVVSMLCVDAVSRVEGVGAGAGDAEESESPPPGCPSPPGYWQCGKWASWTSLTLQFRLPPLQGPNRFRPRRPCPPRARRTGIQWRPSLRRRRRRRAHPPTHLANETAICYCTRACQAAKFKRQR